MPLSARFETSQYHEPLCSICQNHATPSLVFSTTAMGRYFSVDQLPTLAADAWDQLVRMFSTNPSSDGRKLCH